jgi:hypothetical protein
MASIDIINAALAGDKDALSAAFNSEIASRVSDALEVKKVEIASSLLNAEDSTNELETTEVEVDGSADVTNADTSAETETVSPEPAEG